MLHGPLVSQCRLGGAEVNYFGGGRFDPESLSAHGRDDGYPSAKPRSHGGTLLLGLVSSVLMFG